MTSRSDSLSNRSAFVSSLLALTVVLSGAAVPTVATSGDDGAEVAGGSLAIVEEDGFRGVGLAGVMATPERAGAAEASR